MGPTTDFRATELRCVGAEHIGVGFEDAEQFRFCRRALGKPPAVLHIDHARIESGGEVGAEADTSLGRDHPGPVFLGQPQRRCRIRVQRQPRIGHLGPRRRQVPLLGVVHGHEPAAGDEHQGVVARQVGIACGTVGRLAVDGNRRAAKGLEGARAELHLPRRCAEPELFVSPVLSFPKQPVARQQFLEGEADGSEPEIPNLLDGLPRPVLSLSQARRQAPPKLVVVAPLVERTNPLGAGQAEARGQP